MTIKGIKTRGTTGEKEVATRTRLERIVFPFSAMVGQERMKLALLLNAINPQIGGVLIRGEKGTGKSTISRALADLLPEVKVVEGCPFHCNPEDPSEMCPNCQARYFSNGGKPLGSIKRKMKVVDLPLGSTEDRVLGTLDLESAIKKGERALDPGILAEANR
jgi:Mg-chelatase subunit ChlI